VVQDSILGKVLTDMCRFRWICWVIVLICEHNLQVFLLSENINVFKVPKALT
jgi:hypothetical protein